MSHYITPFELIASLALAVMCAAYSYCGHMDDSKWARIALALLSLASMIRFGSLVAPMLNVATLSNVVLQSAREIAPALCASVLLSVMAGKLRGER